MNQYGPNPYERKWLSPRSIRIEHRKEISWAKFWFYILLTVLVVVSALCLYHQGFRIPIANAQYVSEAAQTRDTCSQWRAGKVTAIGGTDTEIDTYCKRFNA